MQTKRIAILFSGNGSNLEALIKMLHKKKFCIGGTFAAQNTDYLMSGITKHYVEMPIHTQDSKAFNVEVVLALSNKKDAYGLKRAYNLGIPTQILESKGLSREEFDRNLVEILKPLDLDLCVLAGFMRILTGIFINVFRAVNIHPSLLPLFKGANGIRDSWQSAMCVGGVSVHYVSEELDSGEIIAQGVLPKIRNESLESYASRIHSLEHCLYPLAVLEVLSKSML